MSTENPKNQAPTQPTSSASQSLFDHIKSVQTQTHEGSPSGEAALMGRRLPPLEKWTPTQSSPFDIVIKDNGEWWHEGARITRQALVDVFSSVLWAEEVDGHKRYFLKTPSDKYQITVIDTPLFITTVETVMTQDGEVIVFGTRHGDKVALTADRPLYFRAFINEQGEREERLYIDMHHNLTARIERNVLYHLVEMGALSEQDGQVMLTLVSCGQVFVLSSQVLLS